MEWELFPRYAGRGGDGARQNHAGRGRRPHPSAQPRPAPLPSLVVSEFMIAWDKVLRLYMMIHTFCRWSEDSNKWVLPMELDHSMVKGSHEQGCACWSPWMSTQGWHVIHIDDIQKTHEWYISEEKAHRQGSVSMTCFWPTKRVLKPIEKEKANAWEEDCWILVWVKVSFFL